MEAKRCTKCGIVFPDVEKHFSLNGISAAGNRVFRSSCKACEKNRVNKYRLKGTKGTEVCNSSNSSPKGTKGTVVAAYCAVCGKDFCLECLPEEPGYIYVVCQACQLTASQKQQQGD